MTKFKHTVLSIAIHLKDQNPIYGEGVTNVSIDDEAGGFFIVLEQDGNIIRLDPEEFQEIAFAARWLASQETEA